MTGKKRHFGGRLFVQKEGRKWTDKEKMSRNIEKKHLKAYLRGDKQFHHPLFGLTTRGIPKYVRVAEEWV